MAKITIAGNAIIVISSLKLEEIQQVEKYRPEKLVLRGGEDNSEVVFAIGTTRTTGGNINKYGASFADTTYNENGFATITLNFEGETDDIKQTVADKLGSAIINLNKIEAEIPGVIEEIKAQREVVLENITVV